MKPWWHGWRLPKRGRWILEWSAFHSPLPEIPRWSRRESIWLLGQMCLFLGASLAFHLSRYLPFVIPIFGITSLASPPTTGIPLSGGGIASAGTFVVTGRYGGTTKEAQ